MRPPCCRRRRRPAGSGWGGKTGGGGLGPAGRGDRLGEAWPWAGRGLEFERKIAIAEGNGVTPVPLVERDAQCNAAARVRPHRPLLLSPSNLLWARELPGRLFRKKKLVGRHLKWEFGVRFSSLSAFRGPPPFPQPS